MVISTKGRYALRFLMDVAEHQGNGYVPLKETAARQEISLKYLEIVAKELVRGGMLRGTRGKGGGYRLCRNPEEYCVKDIITLMEGSIAPVACLAPGHGDCPRKPMCRTLPLWQGLDAVISEYLGRYTLADLCAKHSSGTVQLDASATRDIPTTKPAGNGDRAGEGA